MVKPTSHLFVCGAARTVAGGKEKPCSCDPATAADILDYLRQCVAEREMHGVKVSACECMGLCQNSPVVIVQPDGNWYNDVSRDDVDKILKAVWNNAILRNTSGCFSCAAKPATKEAS